MLDELGVLAGSSPHVDDEDVLEFWSSTSRPMYQNSGANPRIDLPKRNPTSAFCLRWAALWRDVHETWQTEYLCNAALEWHKAAVLWSPWCKKEIKHHRRCFFHQRIERGLPGNPVSCFVTFKLLAAPAILRLAGSGALEQWQGPGKYVILLMFLFKGFRGYTPHKLLTVDLWQRGM